MANEVQDILRRHLEHLKATIIAKIAENNRNVTGRTAASPDSSRVRGIRVL